MGLKLPTSLTVLCCFLLAVSSKKAANHSAGRKWIAVKDEEMQRILPTQPSAKDRYAANFQAKVQENVNGEFVPDSAKQRAYGHEDDSLNQQEHDQALVEHGSERNVHQHVDSQSDRVVNPPKPPKPAPRQAATQPRSIPTPLSKPEYKSKFVVDWFGDIHSFALGSSSDQQFRVRHAPLPEAGSPWPMPQIYRPTDVVFRLSDEFHMHAIGETCDTLDFNLKRIYDNIFDGQPTREPSERRDSHQPVSLYTITHLNVTVLKECERYPSFEMDESYDLEIKRTGVSIISREVWGAVRGLETFSQLVYQNTEGWYLVNKTFIHDFPRFRHRGILLDTARHYLRKDVIVQNLEAMAMNKMNVFHWHIVDDQSFPYQSHVYPNLSRFGAYNAKTHIYTHKDIKEIIEQARLRGIRVIPEFDTPGHTFSWGLGQNHLLTPCYDYKHRLSGSFGPVNPILKSTYRFMETLFTEVLGLFPDKFLHIGGDEVPHDCWLMNPHISNFMRRNNISDIRDLVALYNRKILDIVGDIGRQRQQGSGAVMWQEVFDTGTKMPRDAIVQVWMGDALDVERVMRAGQRVIFSSCWYLDYINYGMDWDKYYLCEQLTQQMEQYGITNLTNLVGGEACLWTEFADNSDIMARLWPRASAAAERLWSSEFQTNIVEAAPRIEALRCRMLRQGLSVGVLDGPGWCPGESRRKFGSRLQAAGADGAEDGSSQQSSSMLWPRNVPLILRDSTDQAHKIYVVNLNAMYVLPLIILLCVVGVCVVYGLQEHGTGANGRLGHSASSSSVHRLLSTLLYPLPRNIRSLVIVFVVFAVCWCVWTSPMWMNTWESRRN